MKTQASDHDLIVTANVKLDNLASDVKDIKDGLSSRITILERWKDGIDIYHAKIPLERYEQLAKSYESFRGNLKVILAIGVPLVSILVAVISRGISHFLGF